MVEIVLATKAGFRMTNSSTDVPSRMRSVTAAAQAKIVMGSMMLMLWNMRSMTHSES